MSDANTKGCVLQLEHKRKTDAYHLKCIAEEAMRDTLANGGTFVMVVGPDKVTVVQRKAAVQL